MTSSEPRRGGVDPQLPEILVCPATHRPLEYDAAAGELISRKAGLVYPIRDGIPIMLVSGARTVKEAPCAPPTAFPRRCPTRAATRRAVRLGQPSCASSRPRA